MSFHQFRQRHAPLERVPYQSSDKMVSLAKRHPPAHEPLGQIDRRDMGGIGRGSLSSCRSRL